MKLIRTITPLAIGITLLSSCGSTAPVLVSTPVENIDATPLKITPLSEDEKKVWSHADLVKDTIPGMSVDKAYAELLKGKRGKTVIVGVIDSGVDIEHEDLRNVVWKNSKEVAGNNRDDDNNGYVDDIHGWNFLGDATDENLEFVRIIKKGDKNSAIYQKAVAEREKEYQQTLQQKQQVDQIVQMIPPAEKTLKEYLKKDTFTEEDVQKINTTDQDVMQAKGLFNFLYSNDLTPEILNNYADSLYDSLNYHLNTEFDGRTVVGDNPDDLSDRDYGNANVMGPDKDDAKHGTHVAGIIAAQRNNGKGMNGVAHNVKIMALRAVPNGDEYDKDIALAIRYAVDNGAKVINTSFGKYYSTHPEWVWDAIKYAGQKDVLIVNAAGNEGYDLDDTSHDVYPNDQVDNGKEISDTFLSVGALTDKYGSEMIAGYSNYGKVNVDVFAPGEKIWSTTPNNEYEFLGGTSMAAPSVAGVAALIRSYYPSLSASQVKQILMDSGLPIKTKVIVSGSASDVKAFPDVVKSGRIVNAYNALIMAEKMAK